LNKKRKRKILVITGSRGEYGYIRPLLKLIKKSKTVESKVLATNMHLLPEFGNSVNEFYNDNISVKHKIYMTLAGYTDVTMVKSLGVLTLSIADILHNDRPDMILIAGDRGEQFIAAMAGAHMNIPVAHIQAGELSGNIDGVVRHAISRFAHIHFASNEDAEKRLIKMGEEPFRIFRVGAPQLDEFVENKIVSRDYICEKFSLDPKNHIIIVAQHPVTEEYLYAGEQMTATMNAITSLGIQTVVIYPNNDAGSNAAQECIQKNRHLHIKVLRNISRSIYIGLMSAASVIVGNSSSGIIEAPTFCLPAVNIGRRQECRYQAKNVINVKEHKADLIIAAIRRALTNKFRTALRGIENPYGDGHSSRKILSILEKIEINKNLVYKRITY